MMPPAVGGRGFARHVVFAGRVSRPKAAGVPESAPASTLPELDDEDPPEDDEALPDVDELEDDEDDEEEELEDPTAGAVSSFPQAAATASVTPSVTGPIRRSIERG